MDYFKKCPKCGRYMTSEIVSTGHVKWTCICGNVVHTGVTDISCDNKTIYTEVEQVTERLTKKTDEGIWVKESHGENVMKTLYQCYGAEPHPNYSNCDEGYCGMEKLAEYETAEEEGRLVVLPCKVGQDLFGIYNETIVDGYADGYLLEKTSVHSDADHWIWLQDKNSKNYWKISFAEIGKTVFITREEAEKALKEMEEKQSE